MLDVLQAGIAEVADIDTDIFNGAGLNDIVIQLETLLNQLEAAASKIAAAWDERGCWQADGARSAAAWMAWKCHVPLNHARRRLRLGHAQRLLPIAAQAWHQGRINSEHISQMHRRRNDTTAQAMTRDEPMLVNHAQTLRYSQFQKSLAHWFNHADPDGADRDTTKTHERRTASVSTTIDGLVFGEFMLDPLAGAALTTVLDRIIDELRRHDQKTGRERSIKQRRADALVEMATRAATPKTGKAPVPLFIVLVGYETATRTICELENGAPLNPRSLFQDIDYVDFERAVFDPRSRLLDLGRRGRLYKGPTRRAVLIRDRTCYDQDNNGAGTADVVKFQQPRRYRAPRPPRAWVYGPLDGCLGGHRDRVLDAHPRAGAADDNVGNGSRHRAQLPGAGARVHPPARRAPSHGGPRSPSAVVGSAPGWQTGVRVYDRRFSALRYGIGALTVGLITTSIGAVAAIGDFAGSTAGTGLYVLALPYLVVVYGVILVTRRPRESV